MAQETNETRVRINLAQGAKGDVKFDITSEFPNEEEAAMHLGNAIDRVRAMCVAKGLKLADPAA